MLRKMAGIKILTKLKKDAFYLLVLIFIYIFAPK